MRLLCNNYFKIRFPWHLSSVMLKEQSQETILKPFWPGIGGRPQNRTQDPESERPGPNPESTTFRMNTGKWRNLSLTFLIRKIRIILITTSWFCWKDWIRQLLSTVPSTRVFNKCWLWLNTITFVFPIKYYYICFSIHNPFVKLGESKQILNL